MIAALACVVLAQPPQLDLRFQPTLGDKLSGTIVAVYTDQADDAVTRIEERFELHVTQGGSPICVELIRQLQEVSIDGEKMPITQAKKPRPLKLWLGPRGHYVRLDEAPLDLLLERRWMRLFAVPLPSQPINYRGSWSYDYLASTAQGLGPATFRATMDRTEMVNERRTVVADVRFAEPVDTGIQAQGTAWIDLLTGWPVRLELSASNVVVPGSEGQLNKLKLTYVVERLRPAPR